MSADKALQDGLVKCPQRKVPDGPSMRGSQAGAPDQSGEKTVTDRKGEAMKIRIRFRKHGVMKFVGHLDMMRYFQKAMRRAEIDIRYSEGFSPHQIMSFAAPLGVGITSDGEYLDIEVNSSRTSAESVRALNDTMAEGVEIVSCLRLPDDAKTAMSIVAAADYELYLSGLTAEELTAAIAEYVTEKPAVLITKKTKKGERELDLKPLIYEIRADKREDEVCLFLKISTGSQDNIKPELVLEYLLDAMGRPCDFTAIRIHRKNVYARTADGTGFLSLEEMGEEIV